MSKFFDRSQGIKNAEGTGMGAAPARALDLQAILGSASNIVGSNTEVAKVRFKDCRVVTIPTTDSDLHRRQDNPARIATESYRALRTRIMRHQSGSGFRSLVVSSAAPNEGKTMVSFNLASSFANLQNGYTLLIDADLRTTGLTKVLGNPSGPGLSDILEGTVSFEAGIARTDIPGLFVVTGGSKLRHQAPELFSKPIWKEFIGWCGEAFKFVIVDATPILPLADYELIVSACDATVTVVRSMKTNRELLKAAMNQVDSKKHIGVVWNSAEIKRATRHYSSYYGAVTQD